MGVDLSLIVNSAPDKLEFVSQGDYNTSLISTPGTAGYNFATSSEPVNHGLGYVPIVLAFINFQGVYYPLEYVSFAPGALGTTPIWFNTSMEVNATTLTIVQELLTFSTGTSWGGLPLKYYLFRLRASK